MEYWENCKGTQDVQHRFGMYVKDNDSLDYRGLKLMCWGTGGCDRGLGSVDYS